MRAPSIPSDPHIEEHEVTLVRLSKDLRQLAQKMTPQEARFLVDAYYQMQDARIRSQNQMRAILQGKDDGARGVIVWFFENNVLLENQVRAALDIYSGHHPVGKWARSVVGIGPVIAAGLLAHIDIEKAPTVGHIWRFAGLDPTLKWLPKTKRPWNADLRVICWKAGESFVKTSGRDDAYYGKIYLERKARETERNLAGAFTDQAKTGAERVDEKTEAYKHYSEGRLPPGHIHARAKRYAVKLFLAHLHEVWFKHHYGKAPPLPYAIAILGHAHHLTVPELTT